MDANLARAADLLRCARRVVVFTGAGVSAESGIPTFRDEDGFWQRFPPEQFACWDGLLRTARSHPERLAEFLVAVFEPIALARPNAAHEAIARLEGRVPVSVVTQNVDGLHQEAGSRQVREIHGSFFQVVTLRGRAVRQLGRTDLVRIVDRLRRAQTGPLKLVRLALAVRPLVGPSWRGLKRPRVVLFGDALAEPDWTQAQEDVPACDVLLVVGTSGQVFPAALLPDLARQHGARVIMVDPDGPGSSHVWLRGRAGEVVPRLVAAAFGG